MTTDEDRIDGGDARPEQHERSQDDADESRRRPAWVGALAAAVVVVVVAIVVPTVLSEPRVPVEIDDAREGEGLSSEADADTPSVGGVAGAAVDPTVADALRTAGLVHADGVGVHVDGDVVIGFSVDAPRPASLTAARSVGGRDGWGVATGFEDGTVGLAFEAVSGVRLLPEGRANGGGVAFSPDGQAIAWIQGRELHLLLIDSLLAVDAEPNVRVLPLAGSPPDDLVLEDWFEGADAQVVIASRPGDGLWRIPMDVGDAFETAPVPTTAPLPSGGGADDGLLLPDLSLATVRGAEAGGAAASVTHDGQVTALPGMTGAAVVRTSTDDDGAFVISDGAGGSLLAVVHDAVGGELAMLRFWSDPALVLVAPLDVPDSVRSSGGRLIAPAG